MRRKNANKQPSTKDLDLLYQIYKYRALSTTQVMHIGNLGEWYVYKKLNQLRSKGFIYSGQISGNYIPDQKRQGSYHRITGKGVTLLRGNDYQVDYTVDDIRVSEYRLPYLLVGNDLCIPLQENGWLYTDSRAVKNLRQLNRGDILHGSLINPNEDKEYALYIFLKTIQPNTLELVKREIKRSPFEDVIVVARGSESYESAINSFTDDKSRLITGGSIKVLPLGFAQSYFNISSDDRKNHEHFLNELGLTLLGTHSNKSSFETNIKFDYLVRHNGEEKYLMDLLDNDLMKIGLIEEYRKERYERDGRRVLVLTSNSNFHLEHQKRMLSHIKHVEYLTVSSNKVVAFASELSNKRASE